MKTQSTPKLQVIQMTLQEQWAASRHLVQKNKKKYQRKAKHKGHSKDWSSLCSKFGYLKYCSYIYGIIKNNKGYGTMAIQ